MKESGLKQEVKDEVIQAVKDSVNKVVTVLSKSNLIIVVKFCRDILRWSINISQTVLVLQPVFHMHVSHVTVTINCWNCVRNLLAV